MVRGLSGGVPGVEKSSAVSAPLFPSGNTSLNRIQRRLLSSDCGFRLVIQRSYTNSLSPARLLSWRGGIGLYRRELPVMTEGPKGFLLHVALSNTALNSCAAGGSTNDRLSGSLTFPNCYFEGWYGGIFRGRRLFFFRSTINYSFLDWCGGFFNRRAQGTLAQWSVNWVTALRVDSRLGGASCFKEAARPT